MAYYYVKAGGTATGALIDNADGWYSTQKTGSWAAAFSAASEYFDTLEDAVNSATPPTDGDFILFSSAHSKSYAYAADVTININGSLTGLGLSLVSVDNANIDQYLLGASEDNTSSFDNILKYSGIIAGVDMKGADDVFRTTVSGTNWVMQDCVATNGGGNGDVHFRLGIDGQLITLHNVELASGGTNAEFFTLSNVCTVIWNGGSVSGTMPGDLFSIFGGNGGAKAILTGVDLSLFSGNLLPTLTAGVSDNTLLRLNSCKLHASVVLPTLPQIHQRFEMFNCDDSAGADFHRFLIMDGTGSVENNDATYISADEPWGYEGVKKSSMEIETTAGYCSHASPFIFEMPAQFVDLSVASSDKITVELTTSLTLTDTDIAAFLVYPDGTTPVQANWVTSGKTAGAGNYGVDPLAAGTTLTTSALGASDWVGEPGSPNFYVMELDTSGDVGAKAVVSVRIEVYRASIVAGELFISPQISLS